MIAFLHHRTFKTGFLPKGIHTSWEHGDQRLGVWDSMIPYVHAQNDEKLQMLLEQDINLSQPNNLIIYIR